MRSFIDLMYCLSWDCYSHLLATDARNQLNKKGGHSSEEDRQKLFTEACERYQLSGKILLADCDWAGTPVYWREMVVFSGKQKNRFYNPNE